MVDWYLGSMGFSWKEWVGPFYPAYLESRDFLGYYSRFFNAVEIDSTFYGTPRPEYVRRWAETPLGEFKICVKTPRTITHDMKLVGAWREMSTFLDTIRLLGDRLGVVLLQFGPSFRVSRAPELASFLSDLPKDMRFAVEVRDKSWYTDKFEELLRRRGIAWAATEYEDLPKRIANTAGFLYVRFIGQHGRWKVHDSEKIDVSERLYWWRDNLQPHLDSVDAVYGFVNNDYAGFSPATVNQFKYLVGLPVEPFTPPQQDRLF